MDITRRQMGVFGALGLTAAGGSSSAEARLAPTGQETLGPYYPVRGPVAHDYDLTHFPGRPGRARGQIIELAGRVLDISGRPLPSARFVLWQANAAGRYVNPVDRNPAPLDPNFLGVAAFSAAADGGFRLRTVKPGPYPGPDGALRTPHIHFEVTNADYRLVTQMYFPGEALNAHDLLLSTLTARRRDPRTAICRSVATSEPGVLAFRWDIVLLT